MAISATTGSAGSNGGSVASLALASFNSAASCHIVVTVTLGSTASSVTSITDTKGNTYTQKASVNGTGVRVELWACVNSGIQLGNIVTINISPSTSISAQAQERSGVSSFGNTATASGASIFPELRCVLQDGGNWAAAGIGFACQSGDTLTAFEGTSRQSSIPAATAVGGAQYDVAAISNCSAPNGAKISTSRNWAMAALELRSGGASTPLTDYPVTTMAALQVRNDFRRLDLTMFSINTRTGGVSRGRQLLG